MKKIFFYFTYLKQKFFYWFNHYVQIIKLFSLNDLKNFLGIGFKIKFLKINQIKKLTEKQKINFLIFNISDDILLFENLKKDFILINFLEIKKVKKILNKKKKYLIIGPWRNQMEYYRFLKKNNFKCFLHKEIKKI